jgi:hypothetical protein
MSDDLRRLLIAVDGSEQSLDAALYAGEMIRHVCGAMKPAIEAARRTLLDAGVRPERVSSRLVTGGAIVEEARKGNFGTIVLGRRRASKLDELDRGRVGRKVCQIVRNRAVWIVG